MSRIFACLAGMFFVATVAHAQTTTSHHFHATESDVPSHLVLSPSNPVSPSQTVSSADLKNQPAGYYGVQEFLTPAGVPGSAITLPQGSTFDFTLHMKKSAAFGNMVPRAIVRLNSSTGPMVCSANDDWAVSTSTLVHVFSCTTTSAVVLSASDRLHVWVGVYLYGTVGNKAVTVQLSMDGVLNGNHDSRVVAPMPPAPGPPNITALSQTSGPIGQPLTITGVNFGATQGGSSVSFNGVAATATNWTAPSITALVPPGATSGPVVVTVAGEASTGVAFTVHPEGYQASYHLHVEQPFGSLKLMSTSGPDAAATALATTDLKNYPPSVMWFYSFLTAAGDPGQNATIAPGTVTFALWMRKTSNNGVLFPKARLHLNTEATLICEGTDGAPLTSTFTKYTFTCTTPGGLAVTAADRWYAVVGVDMTVGPGNRSVQVEWGVEGTLNGNYDSIITAPPLVPPPTIVSLTPETGPVGTTVTVAGTRFLAAQGSSTVSFNGTLATPTSWSDTTIVAPVPAGATTGAVVVTVLGNPSNGRTFAVTTPVIGPSITSLTPTTGIAGQSVTIGGANLGATQGSSGVTFNGTAAAVSAWSSTSITVSVPSGASTGPVVVTVGGQASNGVLFTIPLPPSITSLDPSSGVAGTTVDITGVHFGASQGTSTVRFNGLTATAASWSDTGITAIVPTGTTSGPVVVTVGGQSSGGVSFTIIPPPTLTSLTPSAAHVAETVVVAGTDFGATQGTSTVQFNGIAAAVTAWSTTSISATVPAAATSGPVIVMVSGQASNALAFTLLGPPVITQLLPSSGVAGQGITITGTGFRASQGSSTVTFNGVASAVTGWSDTAIDTVVPASAASGPVVVTVNQIASNAAAFSVIQPPTLTSVTPNSALPGDTVTLQGNNLGPSTPSVRFNGVSALIASATSTTIAALVPDTATSGPLTVTVDGRTTNELPFEVLTLAPVTLTINVFTLDEAAPGGQGPPAGAGVYVSVNGVAVGTTDSAGTVSVQVAPGDVAVRATIPATSEGLASVQVSPGVPVSVAVVLDDSSDVTEPTSLVVAELVEGMVPNTSPTFTLEFRQDGTSVPLTRLDLVEVLLPSGDFQFDITSLFSLVDGHIVANDPAEMFLWITQAEPAFLRVMAEDANGFTHANSIRFSVSQFPLHLTLAAPPSNPELSVANVEVTVSVIGTDIVVRRTANATGQIDFPMLPLSTINIDAVTQAGGRYYYAQTTLTQSSEAWPTVTMRNVADIVGGAQALQSQAISALAAPTPATAAAMAQRTEAAAMMSTSIASLPLLTAAGDPGATVDLTVTSDGEDETVEQNVTLPVPMGTEKVTLKYLVNSLEYPEWVRKQSPFDDVWTLTVFGPGGQQLFRTSRNVNSQQFADPSWQSNGSTGELQEEIDVETLAANGDIELVLHGSAMNVRDHLFDTTVNAQLGAEPTITINKVEKDLVNPTNGDSTFYSIPRSGARNDNERWFTLTIAKPKDATITHVTLTLLDGAGGTLQTLLNDEAPGQNVKLINGGEQIKVRATLTSMSSTIASTPPSTHYIKYQFKVKGSYEGDEIESQPKSSADMKALWRMPNGFARYSIIEPGFDDWASKGAYKWLDANRGLITRIGDISGEHARNIGHSGHLRGVDIDIFHFHTFTTTVHGTTEYLTLAGKVIDALNGDLAAKAGVTAWVNTTRNGLGALHAKPDVRHLYYAIGTAYTAGGITLNVGWAATLLKTGTLTVGGQTLNTGAGTWSLAGSGRITYNSIHNNHAHIELDDAQLEH